MILYLVLDILTPLLQQCNCRRVPTHREVAFHYSQCSVHFLTSRGRVPQTTSTPLTDLLHTYKEGVVVHASQVFFERINHNFSHLLVPDTSARHLLQ